MDSILNLQDVDSQVSKSCSALSCPSEPPDVGNWFSSYEYRSPGPGPDSDFSVEDSAFGGNESHRDEEKVGVQGELVAIEKVVQCSSRSYQNGDICLNKNLEPFSSCSLLSEPPDITNWFSSYIYESPEPDPRSPFGDEISEEDVRGEERFDFEVVNEDENRPRNALPKGCVEHNGSSNKIEKGDDGAEVRNNLTTSDTSCSERILQQCMQGKTTQQNIVGPTKSEDILSLDQGRSSGCGRISLDTERSATMRPPKLLQKSDTEEAKAKAEVQHDKFDSSSSLDKASSSRSSTCTSDKENGFVTTRKNSCTRANDENSWKKPENILLVCSTNTGTVQLAPEKHSVTKRKALAEATNLQQSNALGITGKWQCPQKNKPNVGPAMKQLRLERWVHRV